MDRRFIADESRKGRCQKFARESGTPLAPQTNGMSAVLSVERFEASKEACILTFNSALKYACKLEGPRMLGAMDGRERAIEQDPLERRLRRSRERE
jgi:hypothetical protein